MADILRFEKNIDSEQKPVHYTVDVSLYPEDLTFTVSHVQTDPQSLLKIADELERIAQIIRTDVVVGIAN